jgi:hypothetical protein
MVNRLSDLAEFLNDDPLPSWLKEEIESNQEEIFASLENGQEFVITGPNGEAVKIVPEPAAA